MREKRAANPAPIRSSQRLKRRKTVDEADLWGSIPSSQGRLKRPRTVDDAPELLPPISSSQGRLKRPETVDDAPDLRHPVPSVPRFKRPRRTVDDAPYYLLRSCDSLQHRAAKRESARQLIPSSGAQIRIPSWWAKRPRSALRGRRPSGDSLPPPIDRLDDGLVGLIAERALDSDVADYVRFRAVCRPWRRCSADPREHGVLDRRFHPRLWIMMVRETLSTPRSRRLLNLSTGQCVQVDLPELRDHHVIRSTSEGLLILLHETTHVVRLLNPLTRQAADLPPITSLGHEFKCNSPDNAGLVDGGTTVLLYFSRIKTLAFAKPGDEHWVPLKIDDFLMPTISFAGCFYGVTDHAIVAVETRENLPPRLVVAAELAKPFCRMADTVHLVDNGGELVLVHRKLRRIHDAACADSFKRKYKAYHVDLDAGKMTRVHGLGGRAVFMGQFRALSVSPRVFPYISADSLPGHQRPTEN